MTLDLFSWKPSAAIIVFPLAKRHAKVHRVAEMLIAKSGNEPARVSYWRREITMLEKQMARAGLAQAVIDNELKAFRDAVITAMQDTKQYGGAA